MAGSDLNTGDMELGYQHTLMYGRYTRNLGEFAREEAKRLWELEKSRKLEEKLRAKELRVYKGKWTSRIVRVVGFLWQHSFAKIGEDWVFLALLGVIMALLSFVMDYGISMCNNARIWLYSDLVTHPVLQYFAWISLPVFLVLFSAGFVHILAPQAIGSGIPEMKTILRGVVLKEYLTFRTLIAKAVGLTATLGSGMPLGKEGPLVHIASIVATLMSKLVTSFKGIYENESRNSEMLAAACAVGVSCCFGAPIGGVLFSIEVTSVYFAIRNYWRGFFSAVFGALMFRLLAYWFKNEETITAIFRTNYQIDFPYDPQELFIYALVGAFGGLCGALFVWCHRHYVLFMRRNKKVSSFLQKNRFIYPGLLSLFIASVYFPLGPGQFLASTLTTQQQIVTLFSNFTWNRDDLTPEQEQIVAYWSNEYTNMFVTLGIFMVITFGLTVLASTLPVPSGSLIPIFKMGAAFGRMIGEAMHLWFPEGVRIGSTISPILPGGYAIVGAAAFTSGVTHSISICVVISEMTGQIRHIVPVMVAVLVSNAISSLLQPSLYDSIIMIKKLPYLPDILPSSSAAYSIFVEDFMVRNIKYIWNGMTYKELKQVLKEGRKLRAFPLVDNPDSMILLGSIPRMELIHLIEQQTGRDKRLQVAAQRHLEARVKEVEKLREMALPGPSVEYSPLGADNTEPAAAKPQHETVQRKTSRFEVVPAQIQFSPQQSVDQQNSQVSASAAIQPAADVNDSFSVQIRGSNQPRKSILKKTNSFTQLSGVGTTVTPVSTPYSTVTGAESNSTKIRQAIGAILRKGSVLIDPIRGEFGSGGLSIPTSPTSSKKVQLPRERIIDMSPEEQREWEEQEMTKPVDLQKAHIDPAPFQLVERTILLKVHSMFSLMGVNTAYVTTIGRLVGVVSLTELRKAIEDVNSGHLPASLTHNSNSSTNSNSNSFAVLNFIRENSPGAPQDIEAGTSKKAESDDEDDSDVTISCGSTTIQMSRESPPPETRVVHRKESVEPVALTSRPSISSYGNSIRLVINNTPVDVVENSTDDGKTQKNE